METLSRQEKIERAASMALSAMLGNVHSPEVSFAINELGQAITLLAEAMKQSA